MYFKFKIQQYQYRRDLGKGQSGQFTFEEDFAGYRNSDIELPDSQLLDNIQKIQDSQDIKQSAKLVCHPQDTTQLYLCDGCSGCLQTEAVQQPLYIQCPLP